MEGIGLVLMLLRELPSRDVWALDQWFFVILACSTNEVALLLNNF